MQDKQNIKVTLLSAKEVKRNTKIMQEIEQNCNTWYWTSTASFFNSQIFDYEFISADSDGLESEYPSYYLGIRPVLKPDNLENLIKNLKTTYENDIQIVEYGKYPTLGIKLYIPDNINLNPTGKTYYYPQMNFSNKYTIYKFQEYDDNGQKIVKIGNLYYPVRPVKFYVDKEKNMLISKKILFDAPINLNNPIHSNDFETTQLYQFLNNEFIKALMPDNINDKNIQDSEVKNNKGRQKTYHL